ncbi:MAG: hypothetical protein AB7I30_07960 [Isosphaeraceae bacterium]
MTAKPIEVFTLGRKRVVVCRVPDGTALEFLGCVLDFYSHGRPSGRIRVEGISTASRAGAREFDFSYSGDEIQPHQLGDRSILTDGTFEEACRAMAATQLV